MSTGCEFHADALPDLAAGRLEPARAARVREHLPECARCREELALLTRIAHARVTPPAGLEARIRTAVREGTGGPTVARRRPRGGAWRPWALPLAAAAGLALLWIGVPDRRPGAEGSPDAPEAVALAADADHPYGAWPATGTVVAGDLVLSELTTEDLQTLLEEMEP
ncbi:MAG TPA: zf-HC2 domain-containing protein [Longimicrobiales bacterium]|nr:zf-HC2 domain-containing protein [Longimicrobiales bacterium]